MVAVKSRCAIGRALLVVALVGIVALPARSAQTTVGAGPAQVERAVRDIRAFRTTNAPVSLQHAIRELETAEVARRAGAERDRATGAWFGVLRAIDDVRNVAFDSHDVPQLHIVPPADRGVVYPAGVDPRAIADPAARATYEAALRDNDAKSARFATQYMLRDLDTRSVAAFRRYRQRTYASTAAGTADFKRLLARSGLRASRKHAIAL